MITRRTLLLSLAALPLAGAAGAQVFATRGLALGGSDPVAYFTEGRPRRGRADFTHAWGGQTWHFASAAHRDAFAADPARHAPQYGGWCAWAAAEGYLAPTVPDAWRIVDGRLYLNASARIQRRWERDIAGFIARADANWPALRVQAGG